MAEVLIGNFKGPQGVRGSEWQHGTGITGTSSTAAVFSGSGVAQANVGDYYLNTATGNTYRCTTAGAPTVAKWVYAGSIKGTQGNQGDTGPQGPVATADTLLLAGYSKGTSAAAVGASDSVSKAIGKLENQVETVTYTEPGTVSDTPPVSGSKRPGLIGWIVAKIKALTTATNQLNSDMPYVKTYTFTVGILDLNITARDGSGISKSWIAENMPNGVIKIEAATIGTSSSNYTCGILTSGYFQEICSQGTGNNRTIAYMDAYGYLKIKMPEVQTQKYVSKVILTFL